MTCGERASPLQEVQKLPRPYPANDPFGMDDSRHADRDGVVHRHKHHPGVCAHSGDRQAGGRCAALPPLPHPHPPGRRSSEAGGRAGGG